MSTVFNALPGLGVPIGKINRVLSELWESSPEHGGGPSMFRSSQMNLVLHFGNAATGDDALGRFSTAIRFSRRHPCRLVVICPLREADPDVEMQAKIFSECYIGGSQKEMSCCEAIILSYPPEGRKYLENQVTICLEADLPVYYWPHRFRDGSRLVRYSSFLAQAKRVLVDTGVENSGLLELPFPRADRVRDLAFARLLPIRQSIAQFFSGYQPEILARPIRSISFIHRADLTAEAEQLARWFRGRLEECGATWPADESIGPCPDDDKACFGFTLVYEKGREVVWRADLRSGCAWFRANLETETSTHNASARLLSEEAAMAEALFF